MTVEIKEKKVVFSKDLYWNLIFIGLVLVNVIRLFEQNVWADECFTIELVKGNIPKIISGTINDFHPPLYYLLVKAVCTVFGYSVAAFRLASLIPVVILAFVGEKWLDKNFGGFSGKVFAFLVLIFPTSYYSIEIRMYSWSLLFISLFAFSLLSYYKEGKKSSIIGGTVIALCAAYTHYFALIVVASIYCFFGFYFLIKDRKKIGYFIGSILVCVLAYFPWLIIVIGQMTGEKAYSMGFNSITYYLKPLVGYVCLLFGVMRATSDMSTIGILLTGLMIILVALAFVFYFRKKKNTDKLLMLVVYMLLVSFSLSYVAGCAMDLMSHKFVARYLYPMSGLVLILVAQVVAYCMAEYKNLVCYLLLAGGILLSFVDFAYTTAGEYSTASMEKEVIAYISEQIDDDTVIYTDSSLYNWIVLEYYFGHVKVVKINDISKVTKLENKKVFFIHNDFDGGIYNPGDDWNLELDSYLGENTMKFYSAK